MTASERALDLARNAAIAAEDKKAEQIIALDVSEKMPLADVFLIASGANERQVVAIVDAIEEKLQDGGAKALRFDRNRPDIGHALGRASRHTEGTIKKISKTDNFVYL